MVIIEADCAAFGRPLCICFKAKFIRWHRFHKPRCQLAERERMFFGHKSDMNLSQIFASYRTPLPNRNDRIFRSRLCGICRFIF